MDLNLHGYTVGGYFMRAIKHFEFGKTYTLHHESDSKILAYIDKISLTTDDHILYVSRLPQRRLVEHIDLDKIEAYWMTTQDVAGSIQPSIDQLFGLLSSRIENHSGVAVIEGTEWLISLHGFSEVLRMLMKIKDTLHRKPWSVIFVVSNAIFGEIEYAKWHRESPRWHIPETETEIIQDSDNDVINNTIPTHDEEINTDGNTKLAFLIRIPREGYSKEVLRKRIMQWRRMGLDVSSAEPALFQDSDDLGYEIYKSVEDKVRKAVELDNRLDLLLERGWRSDVTKMRFRVRQLTGFAEVESRINELI